MKGQTTLCHVSGALQQCLAELQDSEERFGSQDLRVPRFSHFGRFKTILDIVRLVIQMIFESPMQKSQKKKIYYI